MAKHIETESRKVDCQGRAETEVGRCSMHRVSVWADERVLQVDCTAL